MYVLLSRLSIYFPPLPASVYWNEHRKPNRDAAIDKTTSWALNESLGAWQAFLQLLNKQLLRREKRDKEDTVKREGGSREIKVKGNGGPAETPDNKLHNATKEGMMFVSEYFLIFIRYIFQLNWNLSGRIGCEWHHSSSWAVSPRLMRCNKKRETDRERRRGGSGLQGAE